MMGNDGWKVEQRGQVRWLCLDRAARKNAMTSAMGARLGELLVDAEADADTLVLVITGEGDAFSAGLDRAEIATGLGETSSFPVEAFPCRYSLRSRFSSVRCCCSWFSR